MSAALTTVPADLTALPAQINEAVRRADTHAKAAVHAAVHAGRLLLQAKSQVVHGEWEAWVTTHCDCAVRTAQAYMRLATKYGELPPSEAQRVAELPLRQAIQAIATPASAPAAYRPTSERCYGAHHERRKTLEIASRALNAVLRDVGLKAIRRERLMSLQQRLSVALEEVQAMLEKAA
ncbi:DUF3102 domain-containing protein [Rubrivivax albus]|uniref:DUF3102 domain-containing protein n=1 Tax=Rubrivivax albus TaxID=2499835 RepID=A0A437JNH6_9BURK|nr:DUF3102 domain-containing protein [Rubrivivax albus]RVT48385.1 DUF3102 domain-containing protein [Rubrivivax albus]